MKVDFIADTNLLIYIHEGNEIIAPFLNYQFAISFITEVELLGFEGISKSQEKKLLALIDDCYNIDWNEKIKSKTIEIRRKNKIKLPDAIIAASAIVNELPLVSADKGFTQIDELDFILLDL
jgi:predicted nucleic acid-binding protein